MDNRVAGTVGALLVGVAVLAGCGGSSNGNAGSAVEGPSYDELIERSDQLFTSLDPNPTTDMPVSGTARYSGAGGLTVINPPGVFGGNLAFAVDLAADFGTSTISGSASNFRTESNQQIDGSLNVMRGQIGGININGASLELDGRLSGPGADNVYVYLLSRGGNFSGPDAQFIQMGLEGFAGSGGDRTLLNGGLIAERR